MERVLFLATLLLVSLTWLLVKLAVKLAIKVETRQ